jgi:hypothetical protein
MRLRATAFNPSRIDYFDPGYISVRKNVVEAVKALKVINGCTIIEVVEVVFAFFLYPMLYIVKHAF